MSLIHTVSESLDEVLSRSEAVRKKRERRRMNLFSLGLCAVLLILTGIAAYLPDAPQTETEATVLGSFLLNARTGGIVAAIVLAFLLGVLAALLFVRRRRIETQKTPKEDPNEKSNGGNSHE